jgi:hypothetical protein
MDGMNKETMVLVSLELIVDLWRYGKLAPVEGVIYNKTHRERLAEADEVIRRTYDDAQVCGVMIDNAPPRATLAAGMDR